MDYIRSTSSYVFMLIYEVISWFSKKQIVVGLSTTKSQFISAATCASQTVWIQIILQSLVWKQNMCTMIHCDNNSTIKLSKKPVLHGKRKHIHIWYMFLRELAENRTIKLKFCISEDQITDILTKPLKLEKFVKLGRLLGVCYVPWK